MWQRTLEDGTRVMVPCGHCIQCLIEMQSDWSVRMSCELMSNLSRPAIFVTLTYNEENLPVNEVNEDTGEIFQKPCVVKHHIQQFMRSLRNRVKREQKKSNWKGWKGPLKYFIASEYGPEGGRPHYHGIIFGLDKSHSNIINEVWNKGFTYFGEANEKSICYVAKYCVKPTEFQSNPHRKGYFDNERWMEDNGIRRRPFRLMSTKLGASYTENPERLKFHFRNIFKNNYIRVGKCKRKIPRYFKLKIYTDENFSKYCKGNFSLFQYYKGKNKVKKLDKNYGEYNSYDLPTLIGKYQYYRHLTNDIASYSLSETNIDRDIQSARQKEYLLNETRKKWMQRAGRYHPQ